MSNIIYTDVAKMTTYEHYYYHSGGVRSFLIFLFYFFRPVEVGQIALNLPRIRQS